MNVWDWVFPLQGSPEAALTCCGIKEIFCIHDFMTGQEYHYACCLSSPYQKQSDNYNQIFFAQQSGQYKLKPKGSIRVGFRCLYPIRVMAYLLMWLTLITITTGMCLMNVYKFVKVRPAPQSFHNKRRNRWIRIFLFPPVSSLKRYFSTHYLKIFFKFLIAAFTDFATI